MKTQYVIACLLLGFAIVSEIVAKGQYAEAMQAIAEATSATSELRDIATRNADTLIQKGNRISQTGLISTGIGIMFWSVSRLKGRKGTPTLPTVLVSIYAAIFLLMV